MSELTMSIVDGLSEMVTQAEERIVKLEAENEQLRTDASFNDIEELDRPLPHPPLSVRKMLLVDPRYIVELKTENAQLRKACHITCLAIEFRGKVAMGEDLLPDESNWRDGVEPYLLALYNWNKEVSGWAGGNMDEERWKELLGHLEKGEKDG